MRYTKKQEKLLKILSSNRQMTLEEIGLRLGVFSSSSIYERLQRLVEKGAIRKKGKRYVVTDPTIPNPEIVYLPYFGYANLE